MFGRKDFDLIRCSDATNGPMVLSEDLKRCLPLYKYNDFPSIMLEITFLQQTYGSNLVELIKSHQFVYSEYMDIVWTYLSINDLWARQQYFDKKACYLKSLRDNLIMVNLYQYYENLEPFMLLDNSFDIVATVKDLSDSSPLAWLNNKPITKLHQQLHADGRTIFIKLPNNFGCLGYNFTKTRGPVCMRDSCGLSLYRSAEFDFSPNGIVLSDDNISLFDTKKLLNNHISPMASKSSVEEVKSIINQTKPQIPPEQLNSVDPEQAIYNIFTKTIKDKLYPLAGNKLGLQQMMTLLTDFGS